MDAFGCRMTLPLILGSDQLAGVPNNGDIHQFLSAFTSTGIGDTCTSSCAEDYLVC